MPWRSALKRVISVPPDWGWGTEDSARALALLKRLGSVTVLNGHIHQLMQKVEGNVTFHTAMSTAFPQPAPGTAASPGPMLVPAEKLRTLLGLTSVEVRRGKRALAITDSPRAPDKRAHNFLRHRTAVRPIFPRTSSLARRRTVCSMTE